MHPGRGAHQATGHQEGAFCTCQGAPRAISSPPRGFLAFSTGDWKGLSCAEPLGWGWGAGSRGLVPALSSVRKSAWLWSLQAKAQSSDVL